MDSARSLWKTFQRARSCYKMLVLEDIFFPTYLSNFSFVQTYAKSCLSFFSLQPVLNFSCHKNLHSKLFINSVEPKSGELKGCTERFFSEGLIGEAGCYLLAWAKIYEMKIVQVSLQADVSRLWWRRHLLYKCWDSCKQCVPLGLL